MNGPRKLYVKSFGCQMNVYDAQRMADTLAPEGFVETATADDADLVILNTCHIREKAAEKVYSELGRVRRMKEAAAAAGRRINIAVAGCVAQAEGEEIIRRAPAVDLVVRAAKLSPSARLAGARRARRPRGGNRVSGRGQVRSSRRAEPRGDPQPRRVRLRHGAGRLRQVLHLLRRALYARRRNVAAGRAKSSPRSSGWRTPACAKSR